MFLFGGASRSGEEDPEQLLRDREEEIEELKVGRERVT